jgi:periplasmic protein TonB
MTDAATFQARRHPTALAIVLLMHGAALTALALAKMENPGKRSWGHTAVDLLPIKPDPPKIPPEPAQKVPQQATVIDRPRPIVDQPFVGPTVEWTPQPVPTLVIPEPGPVVVPKADPPSPPKKVEPARARANLASYVSDEDYPSSAIRNEEQGTTRFRLGVGADGRVTECTVTRSSGSSALDAATCRLMKSRARFSPARDSGGRPVSDSVASGIRWVLPD